MISVIEGQLSIFDLPQITPKEEVKKVIEIDKNIDDEIINRYKDISLRIIKLFGGRYLIETNNESIYCYRNGAIDYHSKLSNENSITLRSLLSMDKILFSKEDLKVNDIQNNLLDEIKKSHSVDKVIKRFGDCSYIVIIKDSYYGANTLVINPKVWIVPYTQTPIYKDEEVIFQNEKEEIKNDIKEIEVGSMVKVNYQSKEYIGQVVRMYGPSNKTVNVIFNGMHSAFYKDNIRLVNIECT